MLTKKPTAKMLREWKRIFELHRPHLTPNRVSGCELDSYFRSHYDFTELDWPEFAAIVTANLLGNDFSAEKLSEGLSPNVKTYTADGALVGIDLTTGFFHVEHEDTEKMAAIYDDLFAYRGLDLQDLDNCFLVAEYVRLTRG